MLISPSRAPVRQRIAMLAGASALALLSAAAVAPAAMAKDKYSIDPTTGTKYKPDSDMKDILDAYKALGGKPIETLTPTEARLQPTLADAVLIVAKKKGLETDPAKLMSDVTTTEATIPGLDGTPLNATIYTPVGTGPFPVVVYFHGGGWVIGNRHVYDAGARSLSKGAQAVVISVDYRLAPEHKFPAAWDDALATYKWAATNAGTWRGDPRRLALAGESAGGNLALATAIATVDAASRAPRL